MTVEERRRRRFGVEFRKEQVALIESGAYTMTEISRMYEVKTDSIRRWLQKYGKKKWPQQIIIKSRQDLNVEEDRLKRLEKENKKLKELVGQQQVELVYKEELIRLAKAKLGEDFEKK